MFTYTFVLRDMKSSKVEVPNFFTHSEMNIFSFPGLHQLTRIDSFNKLEMLKYFYSILHNTNTRKIKFLLKFSWKKNCRNFHQITIPSNFALSRLIFDQLHEFRLSANFHGKNLNTFKILAIHLKFILLKILRWYI